MQQGSYVDTRDKDFLFHNNPQQYEQARVQGEVANQGVLNDAKITELNQQKDLQLNQAELDVISQLTGKNEYGQGRQQSIEELMANQIKLQQLHQQLNGEYQELNSSLQGRSR